jgi:hypothetical protein
VAYAVAAAAESVTRDPSTGLVETMPVTGIRPALKEAPRIIRATVKWADPAPSAIRRMMLFGFAGGISAETAEDVQERVSAERMRTRTVRGIAGRTIHRFWRLAGTLSDASSKW